MDEQDRTRFTWSLGALGAVAVLLAVAAAVVVGGGFNTAATQGYPQSLSWLIHRTMIDAVKVRARSITPPPRFTAAQVRAGFRLYDDHCAMCHGAPGVSRQPWVAGMHPTPPYLLDAARQWRPRELFYIVGEGVKMTGMPAWRKTLRQDEIWDLVAFLEALPNQTASDYARLRVAESAAATAPPPTRSPAPQNTH